MVSLKKFMKVFQAFACLSLISYTVLYAQTLDVIIKECEGSYESFTQCSRTLGDGSTQTASGACRCSGGKLSGGCTLPAATYTETMMTLIGGQKCRDCTVPAVTRCCGEICAIVDETPSCGDYYSCGSGGSTIEPGETEEEAECTSGQVQYKPNGDCGTSERKCCTDGTWSGWDDDCTITRPIGPIVTDCSAYACPSGEHAVNSITGCCCEFDTCGKTIVGNNVGACKCAATTAGGGGLNIYI